MVKIGTMKLNDISYYYNFNDNTICMQNNPKLKSEYVSLDELLLVSIDRLMIIRILLLKKMFNV